MTTGLHSQYGPNCGRATVRTKIAWITCTTGICSIRMAIAVMITDR